MTEENQMLALRDNAKGQLLQIKTVEAGVKYLNQVKTLEAWVQAEKMDAELQNIVAEQKLRTQRKLGELIKEGQEKGEIRKQSDTQSTVPSTAREVGELGLTHKQSSTFQKMAEIPQQQFDNYILEKKQAVDNAVSELTTAGMLRLGKSPTYEEGNRVVGYFNKHYARYIRAYAFNCSIDVSDATVAMCKKFIDDLPEAEKTKMMANYLRALTIGEAK